jgi:hypothetical protein
MNLLSTQGLRVPPDGAFPGFGPSAWYVTCGRDAVVDRRFAVPA